MLNRPGSAAAGDDPQRQTPASTAVRIARTDFIGASADEFDSVPSRVEMRSDCRRKDLTETRWTAPESHADLQETTIRRQSPSGSPPLDPRVAIERFSLSM